MIQTHVLTPEGVDEHADVGAGKAATGTTWVRVSDGTPEEMQSVCETFGIHDLELEDVRGGVRPKVEEFDDHVFLLVKSARLRGGETTFEEELSDQTVGVFLGPDWLVTLSTGTLSAVGRVWDAATREEKRLLSRGPDFLAYRVLDALVEEYFDVLDEIESDIEAVEDEIVGATGIDTLEDINSLRRELLATRRLLWPTRDALAAFARGDVELVTDDTEKYFRDVQDHVIQLVELVETYRDLVAGARDIYLNSLSMSTNEVMKRLTVVATIILPLTFVVGVYGMNFSDSPYNMPELAWTFGYPSVLVGMAGVTIVMVAYFRREGWL
ncbi:magnesium/cobalt transporter CorA [Halorubellus sp. JP-L1]|uniref:magnesium/cobalt transporter CorA n=1 Tax=Halorubellus sp. JP-L1 TaxID=2715753 RepID=UPI00140D8B89|nr:magnesium/cobalt transporter CorA [Halorubellus sp. JP-L1]